MDQKVTQAEFARMLGVTRQRVYQWHKDGRLVLVDIGRKRPGVDVVASRRALCR